MIMSSLQITTVFFGGVLGALLMDIAEAMLARRGITSGVTIALVGRWALSLLQGRILHSDIRHSTSYRHEVIAGWLFHLIIGGGSVALLFPFAWALMADTALPSSPLPYLFFGLTTSALPWFILLPSFGWGWIGLRGPEGSMALLASPLSHIPYGLGIWSVVA